MLQQEARMRKVYMEGNRLWHCVLTDWLTRKVKKELGCFISTTGFHRCLDLRIAANAKIQINLVPDRIDLKLFQQSPAFDCSASLANKVPLFVQVRQFSSRTSPPKFLTTSRAK